MIEFDDTVKYCLDWAAENGDILVIVTADHQTIDIEGLKVSAEYMALQLEKNADETQYTFQEYAGITLTEQVFPSRPVYQGRFFV